MESFMVGDNVHVKNFMGKTIHKTKVIEITPGGNIRVEGRKCLFRPDGNERRKHMFQTDVLFIVKA